MTDESRVVNWEKSRIGRFKKRLRFGIEGREEWTVKFADVTRFINSFVSGDRSCFNWVSVVNWDGWCKIREIFAFDNMRKVRCERKCPRYEWYWLIKIDNCYTESIGCLGFDSEDRRTVTSSRCSLSSSFWGMLTRELHGLAKKSVMSILQQQILYCQQLSGHNSNCRHDMMPTLMANKTRPQCSLMERIEHIHDCHTLQCSTVRLREQYSFPTHIINIILLWN
jgi:hypothetical protein